MATAGPRSATQSMKEDKACLLPLHRHAQS